jgi:hypothetical protein
MARRSFALAAVAELHFLLGAAAYAEGPAVADLPLTGGFIDHVVDAPAGRIDWANGYLLADGIGFGEGVDKQQEFLAERAATVVAARNALLLAEGIRVDAHGTVGDLGEGLVRVEGIIKGHKIVASLWEPDVRPPRCRVVLRVPLWGIKSVASIFAESQRAKLQRGGIPRRRLPVGEADVSDFVLILDARGGKVTPCLFPVLLDSEGRTVYDLTTIAPGLVKRKPPARYVRTRLSFEQLQTVGLFDESSPVPWSRMGSRGQALFAAYRQSGPGALGVPVNRPSSQPSSQPTAGKARRRARRRMVLKATPGSGSQETQLILVQEDLARLRRSPEGLSALRKAQVLIVVDAPAAGTEGGLRTLPERALAAIPPGSWTYQFTLPNPTFLIGLH